MYIYIYIRYMSESIFLLGFWESQYLIRFVVVVVAVVVVVLVVAVVVVAVVVGVVVCHRFAPLLISDT